MKIRLRMRAYAAVQPLRCHENYSELSWVFKCVSTVQAVGYRTSTFFLSALGPTTARSREQPKSTLAHDTVRVTFAAASQKHHLIIHVSAGPIQLVHAWLRHSLSTKLYFRHEQFSHIDMLVSVWCTKMCEVKCCQDLELQYMQTYIIFSTLTIK